MLTEHECCSSQATQVVPWASTWTKGIEGLGGGTKGAMNLLGRVTFLQ